MIRRLFRHFVESLKSLKRNGWMTVAAISSVTITLTLVGIFGSVIINTTKLASDLKHNVRIIAYMKTDIHDQSETIKNKEGKTVNNDKYQAVYKAIMATDGVEKAEFSSREVQLKDLTKRMGKTWDMFSGDANPLFDAYIIDAKEPEDVKKLMQSLPKVEGIEKVRDGELAAEQVFKFSNMIQKWGLVGTILLLVTAVFLISNTIRITIISRSREIQIMRLVGAKNSYIRGPFLLEGAWVGLLGSIVPAFVIYFLYRVAYQSWQTGLQQQSLSLIPMNVFIPAMMTGIIVLGILIGALGSTISMRRFLRI